LSRTIEIKVPDIGDFSDVPVIEVLVAAGDRVRAEDGLITLESDKATMEVPSPAEGIVREVRLKVDLPDNALGGRGHCQGGPAEGG
jgi:dihydrolipoamide dehydrogenase